MSLTSKNAMDKLMALPEKERLEYMAHGRISIGTFEQVVVSSDGRNTLMRWYVAKINGIVISDEGSFVHSTPEEAGSFARVVREEWQAELEKEKNHA